jgi:hypothetical protein
MALTTIEQVIVELYKNRLTEREDDYYGRVINLASVSEDDLIKRVVDAGTDINPATLKASYELLKHEALKAIVRGEIVSFGLGHVALDVQGTFIGASAQWNPKEHKLMARITASKDLRNTLEHTSVRVRGEAPDGNVISSVTDVASDTVNDTLTPGGIANIKGTRIKIFGDKPEVGLFITSQDTKEVTTVLPNSIGMNDPSRISFVIPATLTSGSYLLSIVTQYVGSGRERKDPKTILLGYILTVE